MKTYTLEGKRITRDVYRAICRTLNIPAESKANIAALQSDAGLITFSGLIRLVDAVQPRNQHNQFEAVQVAYTVPVNAMSADYAPTWLQIWDACKLIANDWSIIPTLFAGFLLMLGARLRVSCADGQPTYTANAHTVSYSPAINIPAIWVPEPRPILIDHRGLQS